MNYKIKDQTLAFNLWNLRLSVENAYDEDTGMEYSSENNWIFNIKAVKKIVLQSRLLRTMYGEDL